jgi:acetolactate synthase-1/2/3 large subunit
MMTALGQEAPLVLLSGHTETNQLGRGGFQELRQAEMAAPVAKASWTATATATLGAEVAKAIRIARSGRPGPVHLSLPSDLLDATIAAEDAAWPAPGAFAAAPVDLCEPAADAVLGIIAAAQRPFLLAGPQLANRTGRDLLARIAGRVRRGDKARRPDRAARQGAGLHAEVRRGAGGRCRLPLDRHRSRGRAGRSGDPRAG